MRNKHAGKIRGTLTCTIFYHVQDREEGGKYLVLPEKIDDQVFFCKPLQGSLFAIFEIEP